MASISWEEYTADLPEPDLELLTTFRGLCLALPGTEERVHRTEVAYAVRRVYAAAFPLRHGLEVAVDLLRPVDHPGLREAFPTTRRVVTNRLRVETVEAVEDLADLLAEAHETVGPGTRPAP